MARHLDDLGIFCGRSRSVAAESREIELPVQFHFGRGNLQGRIEASRRGHVRCRTHEPLAVGREVVKFQGPSVKRDTT